MNVEIEIPEMGESVTGGIVAAWLKADGDYVNEGEDLFELETDKATVAVPSTAAGALTRSVAEGDEVEVGQTVALIDTDASLEESSPGENEVAPGEDSKPVESPPAEAAPETPKEAPEKRVNIPDDAIVSPAVRRIIEQYAIDFNTINASGPKGRITKEDALASLLLKAESILKSATESGLGGSGVQPTRVGTGIVTAADRAERQVRKPMSNIRKRIAENLVASQRESAQLTTFNEIDMSRVVSLRKSYRDAFEAKHGVRLGFMSFFVRAACAALQAYPQANSAIDGDDIVVNNFCNIGVAVSTERGLLVPVIKDADQKSFAEIESEIVSFAVRAKQKKISLDELSGGTFTITNGGVFGSLLSTPIPTPRQTAILGMHSIQSRPVAAQNEVVIRPMMYVAVTYDHRVMDGREAVSFLVKIKELVEDPERLLLGV